MSKSKLVKLIKLKPTDEVIKPHASNPYSVNDLNKTFGFLSAPVETVNGKATGVSGHVNMIDGIAIIKYKPLNSGNITLRLDKPIHDTIVTEFDKANLTPVKPKQSNATLDINFTNNLKYQLGNNTGAIVIKITSSDNTTNGKVKIKYNIGRGDVSNTTTMTNGSASLFVNTFNTAAQTIVINAEASMVSNTSISTPGMLTLTYRIPSEIKREPIKNIPSNTDKVEDIGPSRPVPKSTKMTWTAVPNKGQGRFGYEFTASGPGLANAEAHEVTVRVDRYLQENLDLPKASRTKMPLYFSKMVHEGKWLWTPGYPLIKSYGNTVDNKFGMVYRATLTDKYGNTGYIDLPVEAVATVTETPTSSVPNTPPAPAKEPDPWEGFKVVEFDVKTVVRQAYVKDERWWQVGSANRRGNVEYVDTVIDNVITSDGFTFPDFNATGIRNVIHPIGSIDDVNTAKYAEDNRLISINHPLARQLAWDKNNTIINGQKYTGFGALNGKLTHEIKIDFPSSTNVWFKGNYNGAFNILIPSDTSYLPRDKWIHVKFGFRELTVGNR